MRRRIVAMLGGGLLILAPLASPAADTNVLLVTVDTLRADRLSCYDAGRGPTPAPLTPSREV